VFTQYWDYLKNIVQFKFGHSYRSERDGGAHHRQGLPWTLVLVGATTVFAFVVGTLLGVFAGWRRGKASDTSVTLGRDVLRRVPAVLARPCLAVLPRVQERLVPIKGGYAEGATPNWSPSFLADAFKTQRAAALTLAVTTLSGWVFGMRNNMINILGRGLRHVRRGQRSAHPHRGAALRGFVTRCCERHRVRALARRRGRRIGAGRGRVHYPGLGNLLYIAVTNHDFPLCRRCFW